MIKINDDLLNRFLDNELSNEEKDFILREIEKSTELKKRYEVLLKTHLLLKNINPDFPSIDFSKIVMQKISKRVTSESQQKRFLFIILSLFGIAIIGSVGYLFYQIISTIQLSNSNDIISNYSNTIRDYFSAIFKKENISIIGSVLSFIMLISGYFLYNYWKNSQKNFSH